MTKQHNLNSNITMVMGKALITGATGKQGGGVVENLLPSNKVAIRALTRNPDSPASKSLAAKGVELVKGSLTDESSLVAAMDGCWAAFLVTDVRLYHNHQYDPTESSNIFPNSRTVKEVLRPRSNRERPLLTLLRRPTSSISSIRQLKAQSATVASRISKANSRSRSTFAHLVCPHTPSFVPLLSMRTSHPHLALGHSLPLASSVLLWEARSFSLSP